ncbi:MAG: GAF domain-containing protein [Treponema sp.]|jgi:GAF domain-containing protein|nr:GAF domain-containing protein [Treponema sp.]
MFTIKKEGDPRANLALMTETAAAMLEGEEDIIAALANISALIKASLEDINWAGFYILKGKDLVLGPFQGLPACSRIGEGRGICGRAVQEGRPVIAGNVRQFPGHIACDSASASEMVIPLFRKGAVYGVLDLDSPRLNRFSALEEEYLTQTGRLIGDFLERMEERG